MLNLAPNRLTNLLMGLLGRVWAFENADDVTRTLAQRAEQTFMKRVPQHDIGAARLHNVLDFQPGLIDQHTALYDTQLYIGALRVAARREGHGDLAASLWNAEYALRAVMQHLSEAAVRTAPVASSPAE